MLSLQKNCIKACDEKYQPSSKRPTMPSEVGDEENDLRRPRPSGVSPRSPCTSAVSPRPSRPNGASSRPPRPISASPRPPRPCRASPRPPFKPVFSWLV